MNTRSRVHGITKKEEKETPSRWWTCMCMSTCMYMYPSHPRCDSGSPLRRARRVSEEEREMKSQSRALREVFGNEARVKIHSSCVVFPVHTAHARLLVQFILRTSQPLPAYIPHYDSSHRPWLRSTRVDMTRSRVEHYTVDDPEPCLGEDRGE